MDSPVDRKAGSVVCRGVEIEARTELSIAADFSGRRGGTLTDLTVGVLWATSLEDVAVMVYPKEVRDAEHIEGWRMQLVS